MQNDYEDQISFRSIGRIARGCSLPPQRAKDGGCPRVVHGLRAAQPDEGDAPPSPQSGQRWATGGQPGVQVSGARLCACWCARAVRLNRCAVQADACESAAIGHRPRRAAELRSSGRDDRVRRDRETQPLRPQHDRETEPTLSRRYRRHGACMHCAPRSLAPSSLRAGTRRAGYSGRPWPSPLSIALRSYTLGSCLAFACARKARAAFCLSRRAACARSRTPSAPAASHSVCVPHPRIARQFCALYHRHRTRSRGYRRAVDITRCYAHTSCVYGAACAIHGA